MLHRSQTSFGTVTQTRFSPGASWFSTCIWYVFSPGHPGARLSTTGPETPQPVTTKKTPTNAAPIRIFFIVLESAIVVSSMVRRRAPGDDRRSARAMEAHQRSGTGCPSCRGFCARPPRQQTSVAHPAWTGRDSNPHPPALFHGIALQGGHPVARLLSYPPLCGTLSRPWWMPNQVCPAHLPTPWERAVGGRDASGRDGTRTRPAVRLPFRGHPDNGPGPTSIHRLAGIEPASLPVPPRWRLAQHDGAGRGQYTVQ